MVFVSVTLAPFKKPLKHTFLWQLKYEAIVIVSGWLTAVNYFYEQHTRVNLLNSEVWWCFSSVHGGAAIRLHVTVLVFEAPKLSVFFGTNRKKAPKLHLPISIHEIILGCLQSYLSSLSRHLTSTCNTLLNSSSMFEQSERVCY